MKPSSVALWRRLVNRAQRTWIELGCPEAKSDPYYYHYYTIFPSFLFTSTEGVLMHFGDASNILAFFSVYFRSAVQHILTTAHE